MRVSKKIEFNSIELNEMERWIQSLDEVVPFKINDRKSALVVSYSMMREPVELTTISHSISTIPSRVEKSLDQLCNAFSLKVTE